MRDITFKPIRSPRLFRSTCVTKTLASTVVIRIPIRAALFLKWIVIDAGHGARMPGSHVVIVCRHSAQRASKFNWRCRQALQNECPHPRVCSASAFQQIGHSSILHKLGQKKQTRARRVAAHASARGLPLVLAHSCLRERRKKVLLNTPAGGAAGAAGCAAGAAGAAGCAAGAGGAGGAARGAAWCCTLGLSMAGGHLAIPCETRLEAWSCRVFLVFTAMAGAEGLLSSRNVLFDAHVWITIPDTPPFSIEPLDTPSEFLTAWCARPFHGLFMLANIF